MSWRQQLPVYSPLSLAALGNGLNAVVTGGAGDRSRIEGWIRDRYAPRQLRLVDSGTSALALALGFAARTRPGLPVLLPAYGCYDLVTAAMAAGVNVVWYDINPATLQPYWSSLEAAGRKGDGVASVVVVHHYGVPADMARLADLLANLPGRPILVEDAAQASGGIWDGRHLGGLGDFGVLSFGRGKGMTGGGGGALLAVSDRAGAMMTDGGSESVGSGVRSLIPTTAQWLLARPSLYRLPASLPFLQLGETVFRAPHLATAMGRAQAGVLARTLYQAEQEIDARLANAGRLRDAVSSLSIPVHERGRAGYLRFPLLLPHNLADSEWLARGRRLGIMPGYPVSLPLLEGSPFPREMLPGASILAEQLVTLPVHSKMSQRDLDRVIDWSNAVATWSGLP